MAAPDLVRVPLRFLNDHADRGLETPVLRNAAGDETDFHWSARHAWVRRDDPALREVLSDARYYTDAWGPDDCPAGLKGAGRALLKALAAGGVS